jgi:hypothetical protein
LAGVRYPKSNHDVLGDAFYLMHHSLKKGHKIIEINFVNTGPASYLAVGYQP